MTDTWDPTQYRRFADQRSRPAMELLARVHLDAPRRVVDLGCGTGDVTRAMAARWPGAEVLGVDRSAEMLAEARRAPSGVQWVQADVSAWSPPAPPDVIFSNAALHWLPDHERLFPRLMSVLTPGGVLAVQMPASWNSPSHRLMHQVLSEGGPGGRGLGTHALRTRLAKAPILELERYYELLAPQAERLDLWRTEYLHVLEGPDAVLEWVKGTALRPILRTLGKLHGHIFLAEYRQLLAEAYPRREDGRTLYPFPRLFLVAVRGPLRAGASSPARREGRPG